MFVADYMTTSPITVSKDTSVIEALDILKKNKIRQLPVTSGYKHIGLVTEKELLAASPSPATTLSVYEIKDLMSKLSVGSVMNKNPLTVTPYCAIEEAALLMRENKENSLLVIDKDVLVGIITESDIFDAIIKMSGAKRAGTRIVIETKNKIGLIAEITGIVRDCNIDVAGIGVIERSGGMVQMMLRLCTAQPFEVINALEKAGYKVDQAGSCG
ncbi:CBS and ACT domain-containing protein [Desulfofalx alkaliphila]|uniref:CBS and ACT domain-containing protein n=1 Tax=Desulfofalx alkaliphila TaxID=105483 RepID=UPI0004E1CAAB|nr:CBS and ACT domain-containing protein [Desulfofalx alkaliphila]